MSSGDGEYDEFSTCADCGLEHGLRPNDCAEKRRNNLIAARAQRYRHYQSVRTHHQDLYRAANKELNDYLHDLLDQEEKEESALRQEYAHVLRAGITSESHFNELHNKFRKNLDDLQKKYDQRVTAAKDAHKRKLARLQKEEEDEIAKLVEQSNAELTGSSDDTSSMAPPINGSKFAQAETLSGGQERGTKEVEQQPHGEEAERDDDASASENESTAKRSKVE